MLGNHRTAISHTYDTVALEIAFECACGESLQITHRLELRRLAISLWYDKEIKKQRTADQNDIKPLKAFTNFKANLQRRNKTSDTNSY
jgi:hypothetical protein